MTSPDPARPSLYAIYDLGRSPITFDVMNFFAFANLWTKRSGFAGYNIVFVLGEGGGFRELTPKDKALDRDEKMWRLRHVLLPHAGISPVRLMGESSMRRQRQFRVGANAAQC